MKNIIYNAETGETTIEEVADVEMPIIEETPQPTAEEKIVKLQETTAAINSDLQAFMDTYFAANPE